MPLPVLLAAAYLAINFAIMVWLTREIDQGRVPSPAMTWLARAVRYGPPLIGLLYLVTIAGDWPFVLFVAVFFASAFWLLDGLLNFPTHPPKR